MWALHPGLPGVLSPSSLGSWGSIGVVGREMLGERAGSARVVKVFVRDLTPMKATLTPGALSQSHGGRWK